MAPVPGPGRRGCAGGAHLHLLTANGDRWGEQLAFRDALRGDPGLVQRYAALKQQLAAEHADDREAYTAARPNLSVPCWAKVRRSTAPSRSTIPIRRCRRLSRGLYSHDCRASTCRHRSMASWRSRATTSRSPSRRQMRKCRGRRTTSAGRVSAAGGQVPGEHSGSQLRAGCMPDILAPRCRVANGGGDQHLVTLSRFLAEPLVRPRKDRNDVVLGSMTEAISGHQPVGWVRAARTPSCPMKSSRSSSAMSSKPPEARSDQPCSAA